MHKDRIVEKVANIQTEVISWAETEGLLGPGARIVCSISIHIERDREMSPADFFSLERVQEFTWRHNIAIRIVNVMKEVPFENMREFSEYYLSVSKLRHIRNVGVGYSGKVIIAMLLESGFAVDGGREFLEKHPL